MFRYSDGSFKIEEPAFTEAAGGLIIFPRFR
jgi:hypothetical protein